uniref:Uncharacterized protein n=1 Tax=Anguilla anguilla TaxID=7936 RepID=A0A0E9UX40_ANGAN
MNMLELQWQSSGRRSYWEQRVENNFYFIFACKRIGSPKCSEKKRETDLA